MDFADFISPVPNLNGVSPEGIEHITELGFRRVESMEDLPREPGAYLWAAHWSAPTMYIGSAAGAKGLRQRVGNELRWQAEHLLALENGDPYETEAVTQVPLVRIVAEHGLVCFAAVAQEASWTVSDSDLQLPAGAKEWERFIQEAHALITGHRSVLGGGAWENKADSLGDRMQETALARLRNLRAEG